MKYIITESQYSLLEWWTSNKDFLDQILAWALDSPTNWVKEINFGGKDGFIDSVIDKVWDEYSYKENIFYNGVDYKKILKEVYFDKLSNYYNKFRKI